MVHEMVDDVQRVDSGAESSGDKACLSHSWTSDSGAESSGDKACLSHSWTSESTELESEILIYKSGID